LYDEVVDGLALGRLALEKILTGSALYYPTIDVQDPAWLRLALLYWDKIHTIVPRAVETPYELADTAICAKEGQLIPLYCDDHPDVIKRLGKRTLELVEQVRSPLAGRRTRGSFASTLGQDCG
jgi:hypothetical protein